jgi:tRNA pseudouridine synthase 10
VVKTREVLDDAAIEKLNAVRNLELEQQTPVRVLHRRSQMTRDKMIFRLFAQRLNDHWILLHLLASAGTYIKEFCHSDLERTTPNVASLIGHKVGSVDIL